MAYKPLSAMPADQAERYRASNRHHQALWRQRHPAEERANQALKRWKHRRWRLDRGWVPMTPSEVARLGGLARAAQRRDR